MMSPVDPTTPLAITLQVQQWNVVLGILSDQPYRVAAPLIEAITGQANTAAASAFAATAAAAPLSNGSDDVSDR
jgi:hypothetical protein